MQRGVGIHGDRDGIAYKNVLATYTHIHALGNPGWASALVRNAVAYRSRHSVRAEDIHLRICVSSAAGACRRIKSSKTSAVA